MDTKRYGSVLLVLFVALSTYYGVTQVAEGVLSPNPGPPSRSGTTGPPVTATHQASSRIDGIRWEAFRASSETCAPRTAWAEILSTPHDGAPPGDWEWLHQAAYDNDSVELVIGLTSIRSDYAADVHSLVTRYGGELVNTVSMGGKFKAVIVDLPFDSISSFTVETQATGLSRYIEPNLKVQAAFVPNDAYWSLQWGPVMVEADAAWDTTLGDPAVLVAVIDTGVDWNHPDLAANYVPLGYDWVNNDVDPMDDHGHGTHCAGIIGAVISNGVGVAGLAQVQIMAEKGLDYTGTGWSDDLANAITHAVDVGADILSNSWGGYGESTLIHDAILYAHSAGVLVIAAAGNDAISTRFYPAAQDEVVAVTATTAGDNPAPFTNFGEWVEVATPGVNILSTIWDNDYGYMSGTSMAAPHAAGVAALIWSQYPNMTRDQLRYRLRETADDHGDPGFDVYFGYGRINARRALEPLPDHDLRIVDWETPPYVEPGGMAIINSTILNAGTSNESSITVQLLVNGSVMDTTVISTLASGSSVTVSCSWNPTMEGMYNVTSYVVPVTGENLTWNNRVSTYIGAGFPLKACVLDSYGTDMDTTTWQTLNAHWHEYGSIILSIDYTTLNLDDLTYSAIAATGADVLIISCAFAWEFTDAEIAAITQYVQEGHGLIATAGTLYNAVPNNNKLAPLFGLSETITWDATGTDPLKFLDPTHPLFYNIPDPYAAYTETALPSDGAWDGNELAGGTYVALGDLQESAIVASSGLVYISPWVEYAPTADDLQLLYNALIWSTYQIPDHETRVTIEAPPHLKPGEASLLNATVSNIGGSNETEVALDLVIDGTIVTNVTLPELAKGAAYTIQYLWTPTVEAWHNVTAYAPPVPGEATASNNVVNEMVYVGYVAALISDTSELVAITGILDAMGMVYDVYSENSMQRYTEDLGLLQTYPIVIFAQYNRLTTVEEHAALQSYLTSGGNLLVTGYDTLGSPSDPLLADVVRSATVGDNVAEPDLYVVEATHPILHGPYGSFPAGSHLSGLASDCDMAEADEGQGAVTVAELADGYDKILATEGLPGKVVYWNGWGTKDWTTDAYCQAMLKNTLAWFMTLPAYDLATFPRPFTHNSLIILPISDPHGPCGGAHTMDTMGGILIANRLGRKDGSVRTAMDSYSYVSTYDFGTAQVSMTDTTKNLVVLASPGVNQVAYYYNELVVNATRVLPVLFLRDGVGDYLHVQSSTNEYRIERDGDGRVTAEYGVIQTLRDGARSVLLVYGLGGESSMAAAKVVSEFDQWSLTGHAAIVKYYDSNADGYLETIAIVETVP